MLTQLSIRNIALIDQLTIPLAAGLCVLTGETGAGKSIILDALGFVLGAKAAPHLLRQGADLGTVSAEFSHLASLSLSHMLEQYGIPEEETLIFRRSLSKEGKSRAFINDIAISIAGLKEIASHCLQMHGQHDQQGLLNASTHRKVLDQFGKLTHHQQEVSELYRHWKQAEKLHDAEQAAYEQAQKDHDYIAHVVQELASLAPQPGEEEELVAKRTGAMQNEKKRVLLAASLSNLSDGGVAGVLHEIARNLTRQGALFVPEALEPILSLCERAIIEVDGLESEILSLLEEQGIDEFYLDQLEERLFTLRAAARKHQCTVDQLSELLGAMQHKFDHFLLTENNLARLNEATVKAKLGYLAKAEELSQMRKAAAITLEKSLMAELAPLKMEKTRFKVDFPVFSSNNYNEHGIDSPGFLVSTNASTPLGPLEQIASGGELSRFMVAMQCVLLHVNTIPTMVFDEVDTGIGGATADAVGKRLARLGFTMQVIVVTHQPQVAALANHHLLVKKSETPEHQTIVTVLELSTKPQKQEEIARMLAGETITEEARAAARKLMGLVEV
jgi:DNA repair protein RecN (Recombination protein N)